MINGEEKSETTLKPRPVSGRNGQPVPVNPFGRPKGVPNKATTQFKEALTKLFDYAAPQMVAWLEEIDSPERRFEVLSKFADYLFPKLARQEVVGDINNPLVFRHDDKLKSKLLAEIPEERLQEILKEAERGD